MFMVVLLDFVRIYTLCHKNRWVDVSKPIILYILTTKYNDDKMFEMESVELTFDGQSE